MKKDFITSHTNFAYDDYTDAPLGLAKRLGIPKEEWDKVHSLRVLRASVLSPYFMSDKVTENLWHDYVVSFKHKLKQILAED